MLPFGFERISRKDSTKGVLASYKNSPPRDKLSLKTAVARRRRIGEGLRLPKISRPPGETVQGRGCPPHGPIVVDATEEGRYVAMCLVCWSIGPERGDTREAKAAFDESVR